MLEKLTFVKKLLSRHSSYCDIYSDANNKQYCVQYLVSSTERSAHANDSSTEQVNDNVLRVIKNNPKYFAQLIEQYESKTHKFDYSRTCIKKSDRVTHITICEYNGHYLQNYIDDMTNNSFLGTPINTDFTGKILNDIKAIEDICSKNDISNGCICPYDLIWNGTNAMLFNYDTINKYIIPHNILYFCVNHNYHEIKFNARINVNDEAFLQNLSTLILEHKRYAEIKQYLESNEYVDTLDDKIIDRKYYFMKLCSYFLRLKYPSEYVELMKSRKLYPGTNGIYIYTPILHEMDFAA